MAEYISLVEDLDTAEKLENWIDFWLNDLKTEERGMLQALGKNILVKPLMEESKSKLLVTSLQKPFAYEVLSVGEDVTYVKPGDHVLLQQYGIQERDYRGERVYLTAQEHVYAIVK